MKKIGSSVWYSKQPLVPNQFVGTIKTWNETILVKINQANATLIQNELNNINDNELKEVPAKRKFKRRLIIGNNLIELFELLESYDGLVNRYDLVYSNEIDSKIQLIDHKYCYVEIEVINEHAPAINEI